LLSFLVLFFLIWGGFSIIISEVDFICEFDTKGTPLNPGGFWFQRDCFGCELLKYTIVNTRYHIGRLDKRERERRLQVDTCCEAWEGKLNESHLVAQTLLLRKDWQLNILFEI
jgi:hypothetical protein